MLKGPLRISPVFLQHPRRIEGLIFVLWSALVSCQVLQREFRQRVEAEEQKRWTTRRVLRLFAFYAHVGIGEAGRWRWIPSELSWVQREIFRVLGFPLPEVTNTS